jgi:hypothetical protein
VRQTPNKSWQFGPASATLLVAYLLVLQGLAVGFAVGAKSGLFTGPICLSKGDGVLGTGPSAPARSSHSSDDVCCILHCSGMGDATIPGFVSQISPLRFVAEKLTPFSAQDGLARPATPPLGSRAPPSDLS